jgi:hypothetical protein
MLRHAARQWVSRDINAGGVSVCCSGNGRCVCDVEAVRTGVGHSKPRPRGAFETLFRTALAAVPEALEARGLLATFGDEPGSHPQCLFMVGRDYGGQGRLGEADKIHLGRIPAGQGLCMVRALAAQVATGRTSWQQQEESEEMCQKRARRFLRSQLHQDTLEESQRGPPF